MMNLKKVLSLTLVLLVALGVAMYANTMERLNEAEITSTSQTLEDKDGDGYFAFKLSSDSDKAGFSLSNNGTARVEVSVYSADTGEIIWGARVNKGGSATSSTYSLSAEKYYMEVVSDDGSPLNVTFTANY